MHIIRSKSLTGCVTQKGAAFTIHILPIRQNVATDMWLKDHGGTLEQMYYGTYSSAEYCVTGGIFIVEAVNGIYSFLYKNFCEFAVIHAGHHNNKVCDTPDLHVADIPSFCPCLNNPKIQINYPDSRRN